MITITVAKGPGEWREAVLERDGYRCISETHAPDCGGILQAHHLCYRSQIEKRAYWIVENGASVSGPCHSLAHKTHNASIGLARANAAVAAVNCILNVPMPKFTRKKIA